MELPSDRARWRRARDVFDALIDLPSSDRALRLAELCGDDEALRHEVESLLAHDRSADDPIGRAVGQAAQGAVRAADVAGIGRTMLHYRLTEPIGEGGMGVVWKATDQTLGRDVAIKILPPDVAHDPRRLARFEREAKLLASLNHTNIAAVFGLHVHEGVHFLAMEYVPGEDLSLRLARGRLPLNDTLRIAKQIAEALEEAHERGVVHRDLKPANVKLTPSGQVKVLDFGLAKAFSDGPAETTALSTSGDAVAAQLSTREGVVLGTAAYMPPEQARGTGVDKRADIWAFGVMLFEMLSGARPFAGATVLDLLAAVVTAEPDWTSLPAGTPPSVERVLRRCLQKDVRQRLRDIGDARIELESLLSSSSDIGLPATRLDVRPRVAAPPASWGRQFAMFVAGSALAGLAFWGFVPTPPAPVERFNLDVPSGGRLVDVIGAARQTLALSADGRTLVFLVRERDGQRQLYVRRMDRVEAEPIAGAAGGDMPFLSPDGQWLGFAADGKLKKVLLSGGQAVTMCDAPEPRGASWGDDDTIVFSGVVRGGLSRVPASGGTPVPITTIDQARHEESHRWPLVLPGSRGVVFNVETAGDVAGARTVAVLNLATGARTTVVSAGTYPRYASGALLYGQAGSLYAVPFDPARLIATGAPQPVVDDVRMDLVSTGRVFADAAVSGALAYVPGFPRPGNRRLVWIDRTGQVTPVTAETRAYRGARLSPDGRGLAVTIQDSTVTALWLYDLTRSNWNRLTNGGQTTTPAWSPDGRRIFFSAEQDGRGILSVLADGSAPPSVIKAQGSMLIDMPDVLPGGTSALVTVQDANGDDIYRLSLDGRGTLEPVVVGLGSQVSPAMSPSGRFLAYSSDESGRREVYVRSTASDGRKWTVSIAGGSTPRWRADERELFYVQGMRLMAVPIEAGASLTAGRPQVLFEEPGLSWSSVDLSRYDVTPDGQRFLVVQPEPWEVAPFSIVVAPRFGQELKTRLAGGARPR